MTLRQDAYDQPVYTLDLGFQGSPGTIAAYLIPHDGGAALVECGPGSTIPALRAGLLSHGMSEKDVTDVLLTHIHLDHAGAAGWLARQGARIHVHDIGASHLIDPEKLLSSAQRIYGDAMDSLWGEFLSVPPERLSVLQDGEVVEVGDLCFRALETPGHASHHLAYLFQDICFSGDIGGVRMSGVKHLRLPMPPPEFHLELWRESIFRLQREYQRGAFQRIAPTHFGLFDDPVWHLDALKNELEAVESWLMETMSGDPPLDQLTELFVSWAQARSRQQGVESTTVANFETANPSWMSATGLQRYWRKFRI
jgi:glyoxylase-like metal-dependent hydrolase (beta-lactamase superfamily II)